MTTSPQVCIFDRSEKKCPNCLWQNLVANLVGLLFLKQNKYIAKDQMKKKNTFSLKMYRPLGSSLVSQRSEWIAGYPTTQLFSAILMNVKL